MFERGDKVTYQGTDAKVLFPGGARTTIQIGNDKPVVAFTADLEAQDED